MCHCKQKGSLMVTGVQFVCNGNKNEHSNGDSVIYSPHYSVAVQCLAGSCWRDGIFTFLLEQLIGKQQWFHSCRFVILCAVHSWCRFCLRMQLLARKKSNVLKSPSLQPLLEEAELFCFFLLCRILLVSWNFLRHSSTSHGVLDSSFWLRNMRKSYRLLPFTHFDRPTFFFFFFFCRNCVRKIKASIKVICFWV